jgi:ATP-dependent DNA helicase RecQ
MNETPIDPESLLPKFGLQSFRPGQREVIDAIASGRDVLCVMPTGGGKSLCYQLPALARKGTTIVVSPLIALMKDQVDTLHRRGIAATLINSSLSAAEQEEAMQKMAAGALDLVYVAPERLRNSRFLDAVSQAGVTLLAIDEAHCASEWGHDFRPDYARLGHFRNRYLGGVQTVALTATATPHVRQDIQTILGMKSPLQFVTGFARENLRFSVEHYKSDREKNDALTAYLSQQTGTGIIYAATRKRCEEIAEWLPEKLGKPIGVYHAGLESGQRHAIQNQFMSGQLAAIVATNAFGMGIDKSDIRYVVHYNIPGSLEAYYQEAGRAGRDGKMSECRLLFAYSDRYVQEFFIENRYPSPEVVKKVYQYLLSREEDPIELTLDQVREAIGIKETAESIGTAETLLAKAGVLKRLDNSANTAVIRIDSDLPTLVDLLPREAKIRRKVLRAAEKIIGNHRGEDVYVRPQKLAEMAGVEREQLVRTLRELVRLKQFDYVPPFRGRAVHFTQRDIPFAQLEIDFDELARRKAAEYEKLEAVIEFARTARCRQRAVLDYFGDPNVSDCMRCDRCDPEAKSMERDRDPAQVAVENLKKNTAQLARPAIDYDQESYSRGIRIILSGIARMHGRFGKAMIAQMLGGSNNKKIQQWKLNRLSTYGMLGGLKQPQLIELIDHLIEAGLAAQIEVEDRRPTVKLTADGEAVMRASQPVPAMLRIPYPLAKRLAFVSAAIEGGDVSAEANASQSTSEIESEVARLANVADEEGDDESIDSPVSITSAKSASQMPSESPPHVSAPAPSTAAQELIDRLKRWRGKTSAALGIPAYRVISNATLERIVEAMPTSTNELEMIQGIGPATIEQFGYDLMRLLQDSDNVAAKPVASLPSEKTASDRRAEPRAEPRAESRAELNVERSVPSRKPERDDAPAASKATTSAPTNESPQALAARDVGDAYWTWRLFRDGYDWSQVCEIRRRDSAEIALDLKIAASAGHSVAASWRPLGESNSVLPASANDGFRRPGTPVETASQSEI